MERNKAFFLDRDGTINVDTHYLKNILDVKLIEGTAEAIKLIHKHGYKVIVITNQGGIAKGILTEQDYVNVNNQIQKLLYDEYKIDCFLSCPHHPDIKRCNCRKPSPLLLKVAANKLDINLNDSYMIGDKISDVETGINAGCKNNFLVLTGHGKEYELEAKNKNIKIYDNLLNAVKNILGE
jgi:D-glycero-D-manno-heptose 1,7-bisphosphate phosphatase